MGNFTSFNALPIPFNKNKNKISSTQINPIRLKDFSVPMKPWGFFLSRAASVLLFHLACKRNQVTSNAQRNTWCNKCFSLDTLSPAPENYFPPTFFFFVYLHADSCFCCVEIYFNLFLFTSKRMNEDLIDSKKEWRILKEKLYDIVTNCEPHNKQTASQ